MMMPDEHSHKWKTTSQRRWSHAFTLIELILVIAIVAVLMLIGAKFFKQQREQFAVKQTAIEMQQIVQAAQAYYVADTNNYWPTDMTKLSGVKQCGSLFLNNGGSCRGFNSYTLSFPAGYAAQGASNTGGGSSSDADNPFGPVCPIGQPSLDCYCPKNQLDIRCLCPDASYPGHACTRGAPPAAAPPKASVITVSTDTPNANIAAQLASLLPMSKVEGTKVSTTMPAPTETSPYYTLDELMNDQEVIMIKSIYTTLVQSLKSKTFDPSDSSNKATVTLPLCPVGWTPGYDAALTQTRVNSTRTNNIRGVFICRYEYSFSPVTEANKNEIRSSDFIVKSDRKMDADYYTALVLVVTYCVPPNTIKDNSNLINRFLGYTIPKKNDPDSCRFANFKDNGNS